MMSLNAVVGRDAHSHEPIFAGSNTSPDTNQSQEEFLKNLPREEKSSQKSLNFLHLIGLACI